MLTNTIKPRDRRISSHFLFFEAFLSNNVKFGSLNEIITYIDHVIEERPERIYDDSVVLDENITVAECFTKIMRTCGFNGYIRPDHGRQLWEEGPGKCRPGYGKYDRALGIQYMLGVLDLLDRLDEEKGK